VEACAAVEDALSARHRPDGDPLAEARSEATDLL
jgi:hypothetical protein